MNRLERIQKSKSFSGGMSDDSGSQDLTYVFFCPSDLSKDLYEFVNKKLERECILIKDKGILAVRIRGN